MKAAHDVSEAASEVSSRRLVTRNWYTATVPGTVLTTLVDNGIYPEPLYGENNRPDRIPESLARNKYWFRTTVTVPVGYRGRHTWLNFDGINYAAEVWVNGAEVGTMRGAFIRGAFDISGNVTPGHTATIAVLISPPPNPGIPHEHTIKDGVGRNGGITALDGPTFLSTIGWDWLPAIRDRDTGIWQKVWLSTSGPVEILDPLVTTDLPLPSTDSSDISVVATVRNITSMAVHGVLKGAIGGIRFERDVELSANESKRVFFDAASVPQLHVVNPQLWWPNGYGPQNLQRLHLFFEQTNVSRVHTISDVKDVTFGIRKITYTAPGTDNLTISVNGVRVFIRGGNWGLDEALKRNPRSRLEAEIHLHQLANLNMIRNWVGQSTSDDFYELCDKYGLLVWDEFFQANPDDGPDPADVALYLTNVRDKVLRVRNHPSIAVWCARNEGYPPKVIDDALRAMMSELEPTRLYQASSTEGRGVQSHGPYHWRQPREFYEVTEAFKTETGSMSVPTLESIQGMMPKQDWETIDDDWAEHDFAKGASQGDKYPAIIAARYGPIRNLADFVRKSQLANYEAFRAMYEGRNAKLFKPATGILTWMSHPAQPSFVWQLYHHDLEPNSSFFAVKEAAEMVHIQMNEETGKIEVVNNSAAAVRGLHALAAVYDPLGGIIAHSEFDASVESASVAAIGPAVPGTAADRTHFVRLQLKNDSGALISSNAYWAGASGSPDDLRELDAMPRVTLEAEVRRENTEGKSISTITLRNPTPNIAVMVHLQLRRSDGQRVLPVFASDNYVTLFGKESRTIRLEADTALFKGQDALVVLDGWNADVQATKGPGISLENNEAARPTATPETGLPFKP